jgi:hypothetical protein
MKTTRYMANILEELIGDQVIATMPEMKEVLGTSVSKTVVRKLKELSYRTSYSHGSCYYSLDRLIRFNKKGLWSYRSVWFSRHGTLLATLKEFVSVSEHGCFAHELKECLHVCVKESLLKLTNSREITRERISGLYLYCSAEPSMRKQQVLARQLREASETEGAPPSDEVKAALIIFMSVLDEKVRRLFAGLESLRIGYGGDRQIAELLGLDAHTVAKGRRELLERDVELERTRRAGAGRPGKKKVRRSSLRSNR